MEILKTMIKDVMELIYNEDTKKIGEISDNEYIINEMQKEFTTYIVEISKRELTESQSIMVPAMISSINNIERSGDRVIEIVSLTNKKIDGRLLFSPMAIEELKELEKNILDMLDNTIKTLKKRDPKSIMNIKKLENKIDELSETFQKNHLERLNRGLCSIDAGVIYIDIISHLERIADHIYKIAMYTKDELFGDKRKYN